MAENTETPVIVGTAGHVDHGKSALVLALTGTDPDRLPQEKSRGITIDLGFANLPLPGGRTVGLVDVPGHEHYVRAMVAGATGVDVALLVVAADDGVMPQTREHLRILELVGVKHMVVALTKCDLVDDPDWLGLVQADIEEFLTSTAFAGSPVIPCSARTGIGIDDVALAIQDAVEAVLQSGIPERRLANPPRLPVDRSFNLGGIGAVVTGTLRSGTLSPGDTVEISPGGIKAKVKSIQVHGANVDSALAGQRTAVNLAGINLEDVPRGCTLCAPGSLEAHDRFDVHIQWLGKESNPEPLVSGERFHVCTGTSEALGRVLLFDAQETLAPSESAFAQIRLEEPLVVCAHDRFVLMAYSPVELVGGGEVLLSHVPRRTTPGNEERVLLNAQLSRDSLEAVRAYVASNTLPVTCAAIAHALDEPLEHTKDALTRLVSKNRLVCLPCGQDDSCYISQTALDTCIASLDNVLTQAAKDPKHQGMPALTLWDKTYPRAEDSLFLALVDEAVRRGIAGRFESNIASAKALKNLQGHIEELLQTIEPALVSKGITVPFAEELAAELGLSPEEVMRGMRELAEQGKAERIEKNYYFSAEAAARARDIIRDVITPTGSATASDLREALGLSRKYALPLLEHLDKNGFTHRDKEDPNLRHLA